MSHTLGRRAVRAASGVEHVTRRMLVTDAFVIVWAVIGAQLSRFGSSGSTTVLTPSGLPSDYRVVAAIFVLLWLVSLRVHSSYDPRLLGHGPEEYRAVTSATFRLFATLTIVSYLFKLELARGLLLMALPFGLMGLILSRWVWRRWLGLHRARGGYCDSMLVVGDRDHLENMVAALNTVPEAGYRVIGACCLDGTDPIGTVPVVGSEHDAAGIAERLGADIVACSGSWRLGSAGLRRLGWDLEGTGIGLVVAPGMTQVAGPRILTRPVAGLPLMHVEAPAFTGPRRVAKTTFDIVGALFLSVILLPLLAIISVLVRRDGGPALYRQTRVGIGGMAFTMWKFRSMVVGADQMSPPAQHHGAGPLFKLRADPRITPSGRFLRQSSLDELPQLWNVLSGKMSLVGPRPPLASEVARYEHDVHRRLLVKPGMTGLWQVSGRSNLTWEDAVRLDLYYVENWSLVGDLKILWRTGMAVLRRSGAY